MRVCILFFIHVHMHACMHTYIHAGDPPAAALWIPLLVVAAADCEFSAWSAKPRTRRKPEALSAPTPTGADPTM